MVVMDKRERAKITVNWLNNDVAALVRETKTTLEQSKLTPENLAHLLEMTYRGTLGVRLQKVQARRLLRHLFLHGGGPVEAMFNCAGWQDGPCECAIIEESRGGPG